MSARKDAGFIETIYASTVLSRSVDHIMEHLEDHVVRHVAPACGAGAQTSLLDPASPDLQARLTPADLDRHIELALHIQREIGFDPNERSGLTEELERLHDPELSVGAAIAAQARAIYRLTEAEAAVVARFAEGVSLDRIAHERAVSLETIRTQIKAIKMKTGARDLPGLMRLLCGLASGAFAPAGETAGQSGPAGQLGEPQSGSMWLPDGRRFDFLRQGAANGEPLLLLHNLPYGAQLTRAAARYATQLGLSIIAPLRAGFCHSDPSAERDTEALLDQSSDDMRHLMDHLGIARASLIGHAAGATQAIRFATRYPERVSSILIVTRGPVWNKAWLRDVAPHHRAQSIIMRHMPGAGRLLMGATLKHFNKYGARDYSERATRGSPSDLAAHDDPEFLDLIGRGVTIGLRQGPEIFCREWALMELDLTGEARLLPHPIRLIYGAEDPLLLPVFAERFGAAVPKTELIRVPDAGHFLFYTHPREMLDAVIRDCASPAAAAAHHQ
jgi:pimeloyl-ACP methyl ester carboxylesterase/DNA-binding NarL/FixJ family response regulator